MGTFSGSGGELASDEREDQSAKGPAQPSEAQLRYLRCGVGQPGGKLPLFDDDGQQINPRTIRSCVDRGWAEPWFDNPAKPNWLVCRLTDAGRMIVQGGS